MIYKFISLSGTHSYPHHLPSPTNYWLLLLCYDCTWQQIQNFNKLMKHNYHSWYMIEKQLQRKALASRERHWGAGLQARVWKLSASRLCQLKDTSFLLANYQYQENFIISKQFYSRWLMSNPQSRRANMSRFCDVGCVRTDSKQIFQLSGPFMYLESGEKYAGYQVQWTKLRQEAMLLE